MAYQEHAPVLQENYGHPNEKKKECNDVFFLIIFMGVLIMTVYFAGAYGKDLIDATTIQDLQDTTTGFDALITDISYVGAAATAMAFVWIFIMMIAGECLIWMALLLIILLNVLIAILFTKELYDEDPDQFYYWPAIVFGGIAILTALYTYCIRHRIKFAAKHLKVAGAALLKLPMMLVVAAIMLAVQFAWIVTWLVGTAGLLFEQGYVRPPTECLVDDCEIATELSKAIGRKSILKLEKIVMFF